MPIVEHPAPGYPVRTQVDPIHGQTTNWPHRLGSNVENRSLRLRFFYTTTFDPSRTNSVLPTRVTKPTVVQR